MHYFSTLFLNSSTTDLLSIIRSLNTVFTETGIYHTSYVDCLLARSGWNSTSLAVNVTITTNTNCREYSIKTPDDGQSVRNMYGVVYQNKVEK